MRHPSLPSRPLLAAALAALGLVACTIVPGRLRTFATGRIQFPNEAVRTVFERMETEPAFLDRRPSTPEPLRSPEGGGTSGLGPTGATGCPPVPRWWPVGVACAQEPGRPALPADPAQALRDELRRMPEVREAMLSRREREPLVLKWKETELIGEANDGRVVFLKDRREVEREILARVANENDDRFILTRAMARAVVTINGVEPAERFVQEQMPATRRVFAAVLRRLSPPSTWVQLPDGQWVKK